MISDADVATTVTLIGPHDAWRFARLYAVRYDVALAVIIVAVIVTLGLLAGGIKSTLSSVTAKF